MKPVTLWYRQTPDGLQYNHLEEGHNHTGKPTPKVPEQDKMWRKGTWTAEHAEMDSNYVVVHSGQGPEGVSYDDND